MSDTIAALFVVLSGVLAGVTFFGGLWWSTRRALRASNPAAIVMTSFFLRTAVAMGVFLLVAGEQWQRWVLVLGGFLLGRHLVRRRTRLPEEGAP